MLERNKLLRTVTKLITIYSDIAMIFLDHGNNNVNTKLLQSTAANLKITFKQAKQRSEKSGSGVVAWPFYKICEEIYEHDRTINPGYVIQSLNPGTNQDSLIKQ